MAKGRFALGALVGAAAGLIAGFLTAPKAGKDTRVDIKVKAEELRQHAVKQTYAIKKPAKKPAKKQLFKR